jgi:hypothetical protein
MDGGAGDGVKRTRTAWTLAQKREICEYARDNPGKSHSEIARDLSERWDAPLSRPVVAKTLKESEAWLALGGGPRRGIKRRRAPAHEAVEEALDEWYSAQRSPPTDARVVARALEISSEVGGETKKRFRASRCWLARWKARRAARERPESPPDVVGKGAVAEASVGVEDALRAVEVLKRHVRDNSDGDALRRRADVGWLDDLATRVEYAAVVREAEARANSTTTTDDRGRT